MKDDIQAAERGDRAAAKHLLAVAAERLSHGIPLDDDLSRWLGSCLTQIVAGVKPGRAIGIVGSGRSPANDEKLMIRWECFAQVERLRATQQAQTVTEAAAVVAEKYDLEVGTVETYRKQVIGELRGEGFDIEAIKATVNNPDSTINQFNQLFEAVESIPEDDRVKIAQTHHRKRPQEKGN